MKEYTPFPLDDFSVHSVFNVTIAQPITTNFVTCVLLKKENGFSEDSTPIVFDKDVLDRYQSKIEFMLGQLKDIHDQKKSTTSSSVAIRYDEQEWTNNSTTILEILHLACASGLLSYPDAKTSSLNFLKEIYPTVSLKDVKFRGWQKEHKPKILKLIEETQGLEEK